MGHYVPIYYDKFKKLMDEMTFTEIQIPGTYERVWKFDIKNTPFEIRVYSTIPTNDTVSRKLGSDAIRCMLFDRTTAHILMSDKRVFRTTSAFKHVRLRCRELYVHVRENRCPCQGCGGVMVKKEAKANRHLFYGCSNYPNCIYTKNIKSDQLKLRLK